jgi:hypothetical protein
MPLVAWPLAPHKMAVGLFSASPFAAQETAFLQESGYVPFV